MMELHFKNLDIKINGGELVGIIGPNGAGKTYLLKMLSGRVKNSFIYIDNRLVDDYSLEYKRNNIVCVFNDNIYNTNVVSSELSYNIEKLNISDIDNRVNYFKEYFGLEDIFDEDISGLSNDDRVYIKILSLLIINPIIFSIDDLLTYLSNDKKTKVLNYIKENNITLINITSNMEELFFVDKILVMNKGKKELFDNTENVLKNEDIFKRLGLSLPFIYDINSMLKSYELIREDHIVYKELVDMLWK